MFSLLFHKDVFLPAGSKEACDTLQSNFENYHFSQHFLDHIENQLIEDRSHTYLKDVIVSCLETLKQHQVREVFEIELSKDFHYFHRGGWFVTKYCIRIPYDDTNDLVVVIRPQYNQSKLSFDNSNNLVVTAWMNNKYDAHFTLDASKYCSKEKWNEINKK